MIKKLCSVAAALVLLILMVTPVSPAAAVEYNVELITNGGFETVNADETAAENWTNFRTWTNGSVLSLVKASDSVGNVHSGSYAVKYDTKAGDNPFFVQYNVPVQGRFKYRLSFWYKGTTTGSGMSVKFEQYGPGVATEQYSDAVTTSSTWKQATYEFYVVDGATHVSVMPRTYSEGTVIYLDDISLMCIEGPDQFQMETDWVFYYEEYDEATVTLTMDEVYENDGMTVDFKLSRGMSTPVNVTGVPFTGHSLVHKLDITGLNKKFKYTLSVTIKDGSGETIETLVDYIYRFDRPTALTRDGIYMIDGKPFEPVIAYHFDINDAEDALKAGVNVVQWSASSTANALTELDNLNALGLKAAVVCYWGMNPAGHSSNIDRIRTFVSTIKDHPAVFCYMVMDEPFSHTNNVEDMKDLLRTSYEIIRFEDDKHPVYLCEDQKKMYPVSPKYVDCLGIDPYPGNGHSFATHVGDMAAAAAAGTRGEKPVYCVVQAFSWVDGTPTPTMLRTQLYQAMMGGARGYGYYTWIPDNPDVDVDLNEGRYWDTMLAFYENEHPYFYEYYGRGEYQRFSKYQGDGLWYESWIRGEDIYMAVVNRSTTENTVTVPLASNNGKIVLDDYTMSVINGGDMSEVTQNEGSIIVDMDAYQAVFYKITPAQTPNYGLLDDIVLNGSFETYEDDTITGWGLFNGTVEGVLKTTGGTHGNNFVEMTMPASGVSQMRVDGTFQGEAGMVYTAEFDYKSTVDRAALVTADAGPSWRQVGIWLPSTNGEWVREKLTIPLTGDGDNGEICLRLRNMAAGTTVAFDNVTIIPIKATGKIVLHDAEGNDITSVSQISGPIAAYIDGLNTGDRIYLALYANSYGEERLIDVELATANSKNLISLDMEGTANKEGLKLKAFVWTKALGTKLITTIE